MTTPHGDPVGELIADMRISTKEVDNDVRRGLDEAGREADKDFNKIGKDLGDSLGEGIEDSLKGSGKDFAKAIEDGMEGQLVRVKKVKYAYFKDESGNIKRKLVEDIAEDIEETIEEAFDLADRRSRRRGGFGRNLFTNMGKNFGEAATSAIGAGFNVSGRSGLIVLLIPLIGLIVNAVVALVSALQVLQALLITLPALLGSLGLQVGVLVLAFKGVGTAISGAFAAKNAKELKEALKDLEPGAQKFVRALLPLKNIFADLSKIAQLDFFRNVDTGLIDKLIKAFDPIFRGGFRDVARALGDLFNDMLKLFDSPTFKEFVKKLFPLTVEWLGRFGHDFSIFLLGLLEASNKILPLLSYFGLKLLNLFELFGYYLQIFARDPETDAWIKRTEKVIDSFFRLIEAIITFVFGFIDAVNKAGGADAMDHITEALERLTVFLNSEEGQEGLKGFIDLMIFLSEVAFGLIIVIFLIIGAFRELWQLVQWIWNNVLKPVWEWLSEQFEKLLDWFRGWKREVVKVKESLTELKNTIVNAFSNIGSLFYNAGVSFIKNLIAGIKSQFGNLGAAIQEGMRILGEWLPGSPAKKGPLSGSGYSYFRGQALVKDFAAGMTSEQETLSSVSNSTMGNINFGPGSIRVGFSGAVPTPEQARITGSAVGAGITNTLAARNTRLAIRTL